MYSLETKIDNLEIKIDKLETKIDKVLDILDQLIQQNIKDKKDKMAENWRNLIPPVP